MSSKAVRWDIEDRILVVTFGDPDSSVNTWNSAISEGFMDCIEACRDYAEAGQIDGAIFISNKEKSFNAGADLKNDGRPETRLDKMRRYEFFHNLFRKIETLPIITLAAISGHALGGGLEFALSCAARIARSHEKTVLGLPEVGIGVIPCYGGTQRLPRLIGYPAVDMILGFKKVSAEKALELGIIDSCIREDQDLLQEAKLFIRRIIDGKVTLTRSAIDFSDAVKQLAAVRARYPEPTQAQELVLKIVEDGLTKGFDTGCEGEKRHVLALSMARTAGMNTSP